MNNISRRQLLQQMSIFSGLALSYPAALLAKKRLNPERPLWLEDLVWQTLLAVQNTLFPADEKTPGAEDIGAHLYLHRAIENPLADGADKVFIFQGVGWLNDLSQQRHTMLFIALDDQTKDQLLMQIVQSKVGRNWVSTLLTYLLESLVSDPIYGGNIKGHGWQWLEHQPGFPSPSIDKTWDQLLERRTKA